MGRKQDLCSLVGSYVACNQAARRWWYQGRDNQDKSKQKAKGRGMTCLRTCKVDFLDGNRQRQ